MPLPLVDMTDCTTKKKCKCGPNQGEVYDVQFPCGDSGGDWIEDQCDCTYPAIAQAYFYTPSYRSAARPCPDDLDGIGRDYTCNDPYSLQIRLALHWYTRSGTPPFTVKLFEDEASWGLASSQVTEPPEGAPWWQAGVQAGQQWGWYYLNEKTGSRCNPSYNQWGCNTTDASSNLLIVDSTNLVVLRRIWGTDYSNFIEFGQVVGQCTYGTWDYSCSSSFDPRLKKYLSDGSYADGVFFEEQDPL